MPDKKVGTAKKGPDEQARSLGKPVVLIPPPLPKESLNKLETARISILATKLGKGATIAFSVMCDEHFSSGQDVLLTYPTNNTNPILNEGGGWVNESSFIAPNNGVYCFSWNFVKDTGYHGGSCDDVMIFLAKNGKYIGVPAWAGEMVPSSPYDRSTGASNIILRLNAGDYIQTYVHSDGLPPVMRHIFHYNLCGHRIGD